MRSRAVGSKRFFVESGTVVRQGEPILKLSNTNLLMNIMYHEAELFQQRNNLRNTRLLFEQGKLALEQARIDLEHRKMSVAIHLERQKNLAENQLIPQAAYDQTVREFDYLTRKLEMTEASSRREQQLRRQQLVQLEESTRRLEENLRLVKSKLEELVIKAPVDGLLTSLEAKNRSVENGRRESGPDRYSR